MSLRLEGRKIRSEIDQEAACDDYNWQHVGKFQWLDHSSEACLLTYQFTLNAGEWKEDKISSGRQPARLT